ncbi:MAG: hypothetical protein ACRECJ_10280 [Limisphaerales bacterium]
MQERIFNATYFLVKYGFEVLSKIKSQINFEHFDHQVISL